MPHDEQLNHFVDDDDDAPARTGTRGAGRSAGTWAKLLVVWALGLVSWTLYLIAMLYLWIRFMG